MEDTAYYQDRVDDKTRRGREALETATEALDDDDPQGALDAARDGVRHLQRAADAQHRLDG